MFHIASFVFFLSIAPVHTSDPEAAGDPKLIAHLTFGDIEGRLITAENGRQGIGFFGIPYAQPPLGELRFRAPAPPEPWTGVRACTEYKANCWQIHTTMDGENFTGIEDCLYLNVFVGLNCSSMNNHRCPVVFYIHGGGWNFDTPTTYSAEMIVDNFASRDLVLVTIAYRLNVFGFWSSGGEEARGNYGFHDMIAGLRWVHREIRVFGGEPESVTIMGHSAGGASVTLLTLSPMTEGLFHRAIIMSAKAVDENLLGDNVDPYHRRTATAVGCTDGSSTQWEDRRRRQAVVDCMRRVDMDVLGKAYLDLSKPYAPRTAPKYDGPTGLFPRPYRELIQNRRPIPVMIGTASKEMGKMTHELFDNAKFESLASVCRDLVGQLGIHNREAIVRACLNRYVLPYANRSTEIGPGSFWARQTQRVEEMYYYHSPCFKEANSLRRTGARVYLYSFEYEKPSIEGTPYHAFDLTYLLGLHKTFPFDERDERIQRIYAPLFANFAKYGEPTPSPPSGDGGFAEWTPLEWPAGLNYYKIDLPGPSLRSDFHEEDILFFDYIIPMLERDGADPEPEASGGSRTSPIAISFQLASIILVALGISGSMG